MTVDVWKKLKDECSRADTIYGTFSSAHEGFGVLAEEVAELLGAIRNNSQHDVRCEAVQVASVAMRIAEACDCKAFSYRSGFDD